LSRRIIKILPVVFLLAVSTVGALDLRDGRMLLSLDEKTARFTLYYLADAARNNYVAMLYDQEPRTSFPTLSWNGKTYRLGESPDFRFTVKKDGAAAVAEYRSSFATVRQTFRLIHSKGAADSDGLLVEFAIENLSKDTASVGLRILWDTYLGEKSRKHFEVGGSGTITGETTFSEASIPRQVISPGDSGASLQIQLIGEGLSQPDRLVLANWKRLNDSGWSFEPSAGRGFTLLPYSIDDSAAALFFEPVELRAGSVRVIRTALGNRAASGYSAALPSPSASFKPVVSPPPEPLVVADTMSKKLSSDPFVTARTDIEALREIISRIDALMASGNPTTEQLNDLRSQLEQIRNRRKGL
jgi:hypothetical protein